MRQLLSVAVCAGVLVAGGAFAQSPSASGAQFMLTGVVVVEGGGRAWLQEPQLTGNQVVSLRAGDVIGPYRLTKVLEDRIEMVGPGGPFSVMLAGAQGPVTASVQPPAPPPSLWPPASTGPLPDGRMPDPPLGPGPPPGTQPLDFASILSGIRPVH